VKEYFVVYDTLEGAETMRGSGPEGMVALQDFGPDSRVLKIPVQATRGELSGNLDLLRAALVEAMPDKADEIAAASDLTALFKIT
jgi:hypothetical protein